MHIENKSGASAPTPSSRPFDPAAWLALYVELGGGYTVNSIGACLHWPSNISQQERAWLSEHKRQIRADRARQIAVRDYLASLSPREAAA